MNKVIFIFIVLSLTVAILNAEELNLTPHQNGAEQSPFSSQMVKSGAQSAFWCGGGSA